MSFFKDYKAFTLIELIIVIAIVALIAAAVFVSVNPAQRLGDTKDAVRASDTVAIEKAIQKRIADGYTVPVEMAALTEDTPYMLVTEGSATSGTCNCNTLDESIARIDLAGEFESYLGSSIPVDEEATGDDTGYYITRKGNSFYVESCNAYGDEFVSLTPMTAGPNYAGTGTNVNNGGSAAWSDVSNITTDDGSYAYYNGTLGSDSDYSAKLIKEDGSYSSEDKSLAGIWGTTWTVFEYGDDTSLWGETWTASDINDPDFGFALQGDRSAFGQSLTLEASNFGFAIPVDAVITGIKVEVEKNSITLAMPMRTYGSVDFIRITVYYEI